MSTPPDLCISRIVYQLRHPNLKQVLHNSHSKYDLDKSFVRRTCDERRVARRGSSSLFSPLLIYSSHKLDQRITYHEFRTF